MLKFSVYLITLLRCKISMKKILLLILIVITSVVKANQEVSDICMTAIHEHYLFLLLVQPNIKTVPQKIQPQMTEKAEKLLLRIKGECPPAISNKFIKLTDNFNISQSDFLKNLKQDMKIFIPLVGEDIPLNRANMDDNEVMLWASNAILKTYQVTAQTFKNFENVRKLYLPSAFSKVSDDIINTYLKNYLIKRDQELIVREQDLYLQSSIASIPKITFQGVDAQKNYTWRLTIPLLVEMKVSGRIKKEKINVLVHITRVQERISPDGVAISSFEIGS